MRIVVHDFSGHPFQAQLSRALARRGHEVVHLYCGDLDGMKGALRRAPADPESLDIRPVTTGRAFSRYSLVGRLFAEWRYGRALADEIRGIEPDAVISANTPLISQAMALRAAKGTGAGFTFWQQDVLSVAIASGLRGRLAGLGAVIGALFRIVEQSMLRRSDRIVVVSPDYAEVLAGWGIDASAVRVIENWAPVDELPSLPKRNAWSEAHGLAHEFVFLYAGTLGLKHDPSMLVSLADALPNARVLVIAEGPGAEWLRDVQDSEPRANLLLMSGLPYEDLPGAMAAGDVLLALLEPDAGAFSVPSKVLSYMCAARPILAAIPSANLAHRLLVRVGCGIAVEPGDVEGFVAGATRLSNDAGLRATFADAAASYASHAFNIERIAREFEDVVGRSIGRSPSTEEILVAA